MWVIDLTHTSHTAAQTGIQQVCRSLHEHLAQLNGIEPVIYDRFAGRWRTLDKREQSLIASRNQKVSRKRSSRWTAWQKLRGSLTRALGRRNVPMRPKGIFMPEIIGRHRIRTLFKDPFTSNLKKVAIFYDAIPMKFPDWSTKETVSHFPDYIRCLARFDHIACISQASRDDLLEQWHGLGIKPASTSVVPLGIPRAPGNNKRQPANDPPMVLCIGTLERRKNHHALMQAAEELWERQVRFKLVLAGMVNASAANETIELYRHLSGKHRQIELTGPLTNVALDRLLREADLLAYPSLYEGFGLPVLEALANGIPVLTTAFGALAEHVTGGGCKICDGSVDGIRMGLEALITNPDERETLAREAAARKIRSMADTAEELSGLLDQVADDIPFNS